MSMKTNSSARPNGAVRREAPARYNGCRSLLLVAALAGAGITAHAAGTNILANPGFETTPIFNYWTAQTTEGWSMNGSACGAGGLIRTGANSLWMQGLYGNGGAPVYYNMCRTEVCCFGRIDV